MIVGEVMAKKVITIKGSDSLKMAHELMVKNSIRHLPVVEKKELLGIITESDIRAAFIRAHDESGNSKTGPLNPARIKVSDYMTEDPMVVKPETNIEDAALTIYKNKIGALPVVEDHKLVGIVSILDMLGLFIDMMGILHSSSRVDVVMNKNPENFEKVSKIIHDVGINIISIGMAPYPKDENKQIYYFRLDLCKTEKVVQKIKKAGFKVIAAID